MAQEGFFLLQQSCRYTPKTRAGDTPATADGLA